MNILKFKMIMKKIFIAAMVAVSALNANAQTWVGGSIGFTTKHVNGTENNTNTFSITPEIGSAIDDNMDVAVALGYTHNNGKVNTWSIQPYLRYKFVKEGNFTAFLDGGIKYSTEHTNGFDKNKNYMGVNIAPGIAYAVSSNVSLVAHLGDGLKYGHTWTEGISRENKFALDLFNGVSFGAYYNF